MRIFLHLGRYRFTPSVLMLTITLILLAFFIALGCWQLQRAETKCNLQAIYDARLQATPLTLAQLSTKTDLLYYPVKLSGHYDNAHTILLDNKTYQHQVGYEVLTPFLPNGSSQWLLVNRGWIPLGAQRNQLPTIAKIKGDVVVQGNIYQPTAKPFLLSQQQEKPTWPLRVQAIEMEKLANILNKPLFPFLIQLSSKADHGFSRDWQPVTMPSYKHWGYAVQWFAFAFVLLIIFIFLNIHRERHHD